MASLIVAGDTSGTVTLQAPAIAGSTVLTLPSTSGTLVTTAGGTTVPFALGSAASPSITFTGDTNTGIFSPGADTIGFSEGGTEVMRIDSSGNVGIGTNSPSRRLHVLDSAPFVATFQSSGTAVYTAWQASGGTVGYIGGAAGLGAGGATDFGVRAETNLIFITSAGSERMRINTDGNVVVAGTSVSDFARMTIYSTESNNSGRELGLVNDITTFAARIRFTNPNGTVGSISTTGSSTAYNTSSDYRLKENIAPMTDALATVQALKPVTYKWKADGSNGQGFIAHELAEVVPDAVAGEKDAVEMQSYEISPAVPATFDEEGNELTPAVEAIMGEREVPVYQGVDTSFLVATLTAAIQEQQAIIQSQADTITAMETRLTALENK